MVKLLVADDEQKICRLLKSFFSERGFEVLLAHDGQAALACIRQERPHLIFLDLHMPGMNGMDVLREARKVDETMKIIIVTAIEDEEMIRRAKSLGAVDYVVKPFSLEYLKEDVLTKVSTSLYEDLRAVNKELQKSLQDARKVTLGIVEAFSLVISKIDPHYTHQHVSRSMEYATKLITRLRQLGVSLGPVPEELLLAGILLHDVGKIFTPKEILYKPGPLSPDEWKIMRRHPVEGAELLEKITGSEEVARIVRCHQESYDGSGYPAGLKEEEIPVGARIACVVDAFDAMTTDRPYRKGMSVGKAVDELKRNRGTQFDPMVVDALLSLYDEGNLQPIHAPDPARCGSVPAHVASSGTDHAPRSAPARARTAPTQPSKISPS